MSTVDWLDESNQTRKPTRPVKTTNTISLRFNVARSTRSCDEFWFACEEEKKHFHLFLLFLFLYDRIVLLFFFLHFYTLLPFLFSSLWTLILTWFDCYFLKLCAKLEQYCAHVIEKVHLKVSIFCFVFEWYHCGILKHFEREKKRE